MKPSTILYYSITMSIHPSIFETFWSFAQELGQVVHVHIQVGILGGAGLVAISHGRTVGRLVGNLVGWVGCLVGCWVAGELIIPGNDEPAWHMAGEFTDPKDYSSLGVDPYEGMISKDQVELLCKSGGETRCSVLRMSLGIVVIGSLILILVDHA